MRKIKRLKEVQAFPEDAYINLSLSDLVLYALFSLGTNEVETTFENLVVESYKLFPQKFHLQGYPEYPDANRVRREIQRMEGTLPTPGPNLVKGNMKTSYKIAESGFVKLGEIQIKLASGEKDKVKIDKKLSDRRSKIGRVLSELEKHPLYHQYLRKGENIDIPESLLRDLLFATMETSHDSLRENMNTLKEYCDVLNKNDIKDFLNFCANKHGEIFYSTHE